MSFTILSNDLNDRDLEEDPIAKEFDILNNEVNVFTDGKALVKFVSMSAKESRVFFENPDVENYWVDLKYSLQGEDGERHFRNRFAYISYNGSFPVKFGSPLLEEQQVQIINDLPTLQSVLKRVVAEQSFVRSLLKAKRGTTR